MRPFKDIDVLDLTQSVAGPVSTQYLGALGANVVKVEPPEGGAFRDLLDGAIFTSVNLGGKESICIDLKDEDGREVATSLAEQADVIVESMRPGVVERFGLDYETISGTNEDVIYLSISGFGQDGPYSEWPAYDPVIQAMSGLMSTIGYPDRPPVRIGASVIDWGTGTTAAFLLASAIFERQHTGDGEFIDVNLFEVATAWMGYWIAHYTDTGEIPKPSGQGWAGLAPNEVFHAADDEPFYLAVVNDAFFRKLCGALDREDLAEDERFETNERRWENRDELREILDSEFRRYDREELCETLALHGVPSGPLRKVDELVEDDPHVQAREILTETHNVHKDTDVKTAGLPFKTAEGRPPIGEGPPKPGEDTRGVLERLGYDEATIDRLLQREAVSE